MNPNLRTALLAGGAVLALLVAGGIGYAIRGSGSNDSIAGPAPSPATNSFPAPVPSTAVSATAISAGGAILRTGDQVTAGTATSVCSSLVMPGLTGQCGDVTVAGGRVVWIVERSAIANGVSGFAVRILSFSPADAGWVDSLHADDLQGRRWSNVSVLAADLTGDGIPELVVGYRGLGDKEPLDLDVVGYTSDGAPQVVAHPDRADRGSLVVQGVQLLNYAGVYAVGEQACCPGTFERRTMAFANGQLLEVATENVPPGSVPASQV